ncbi:gamma-glutamyltransferase family protein [Caulobacter sp. RHG1]|uniref:gamma-glutamyltransferase family protein n=1 Tax=Caulobacter sp. (strain RHG1) TaxID=2545762 RepID=UPI001554B435|nr:gamma-glutamyltransferase family protein [Caulobacter sp. RHG1]NQE63625.1 Gamma-glutamyltranspeptidase or Glutathione hydrolase [Caulobacter sp. RHG1]
MFTTRPEIRGTFGVVASTHWIASSVGMSVLEKGGNAFDAAAAVGFALQVVEPHLCGPAGEVPIIFHSVETDRVEVLCGQGSAPAAATIEAFKALGLDAVPGSGLLAAVAPGSFGAWLTLVRDHGRLRLADVLEPALGYALNGHPVLPGVSRALAELKETFQTEWKSSAAIWLPGGEAPAPQSLFRNPTLAATWQRILDEAGEGTREQQLDRALAAWYEGFVAEAIDRFCRAEPLMDSSGRRHRGLLTGQDMAGWRPTYEAPTTFDYHGWTVCKTQAWGQGPVLLQALSLLKGFDLSAMDPNGADFAHVVLEAAKLAFADREAYYGDPDFVDVPIETLLSEAYAVERRKLIGDRASDEIRPGILPGFEDQVARALGMVKPADGTAGGLGIGEPTMAHLKPTLKPGDTVHLDVIDRWGNMVSATPSGGWPQSSPTIPELGFALNTRAQMFWLEPGLPSSLAPGKRPRTTLTPTLALHEGRPALICGTPGGDQQDQWQLALLLRRIHHGLGLQEAIDLPLFHTVHFPSSFYPREALPGVSVIEESAGAAVIADLKARGHDLQVAPAWSAGRLTAAERRADGLLSAAATPRLMQAYAVGR